MHIGPLENTVLGLSLTHFSGSLPIHQSRASQVTLVVKNSLANAGDIRDSDHDQTHVRSLGQEDPLEKGMASHSSILAWSILWTKEPGRLWFMGLQRVGQD